LQKRKKSSDENVVKYLREELIANDKSIYAMSLMAHGVNDKRTDLLEQKEKRAIATWRTKQNIRQWMKEIESEKLSVRTRTPFFMEEEDR